MKLSRLWRALLVALLIAAPLAFGACGAPATPPVPPVEVPSPVVLKFVPYDDVRVDYSSISKAPAAVPSITKYVGEGGTYSDAIAMGPEFTRETDDAIAFFLTILADIEIPSDPTVTIYEADVAVESGTVHLKFDFADFDLDNSGAAEGCTGSTSVFMPGQDTAVDPSWHPVCARVWADDVRAVAWVFDQVPYNGNLGASRFKVVNADAPDGSLRAAVNFDHRDPLDVLTESRVAMFDTEDALRASQHIVEEQAGDAATALKTLNVNYQSMAGEMKYLGRYREEAPYWSGSIAGAIAEAFTGLPPFTAVCAVIATGEAAVDASACDDISVAGLDFTSPVDPLDVAIPADFPATPTF